VYARVVTNQTQPGKIDEWLALIRDSVVPALKEQDGFLGFVHRRLLSILAVLGEEFVADGGRCRVSMSYGSLSSWSPQQGASPSGSSVRTCAAFDIRASSARLHAGVPLVAAAGEVCRYHRASAGGFRLRAGADPALCGQVLRTQHRRRLGRAEQELCAQALAGGSPGTAGVCRFQPIASGLAP
jgi:hypothetical protein